VRKWAEDIAELIIRKEFVGIRLPLSLVSCRSWS